jgi:phospholipase C
VRTPASPRSRPRGWSRSTSIALVATALALSALGAEGATGAPHAGVNAAAAEAASFAAGSKRIQHVVIIFQENHTFDELFGWLCVQHPERQCNGVARGKLSSGRVIRLKVAGDIPPHLKHTPADQAAAMNGGRMNGFNHVRGCEFTYQFRCYRQYRRSGIPSLWRLAQNYAISDRTFELDPTTSWGAHLELASATLDGFVGFNPVLGPGHDPGNGWGCDSHLYARWMSPQGVVSLQPSCIPRPGSHWTPAGHTEAGWVPTIMERLEKERRSWRIYATRPFTRKTADGYAWSICPSFASCLLNPDRHDNLVPRGQLFTAVRNGHLPAFSVVLPSVANSSHNGWSMMAGDNWIARVVNAIGTGPDWRSTAVFITFDDCGCFYDHVAPPAGSGFGIRVPLVIVSPYAKTAHTDSNTASFASMLAFTEHLFGLEPLNASDRNAYTYWKSFNFQRTPARYEPLRLHPVPSASKERTANKSRRAWD